MICKMILAQVRAQNASKSVRNAAERVLSAQFLLSFDSEARPLQDFTEEVGA